MKAQRVDTWAVSIADKPGALAAKLKTLSTAGVNLEFLIARRAPEKPRTGVIFVTPIKGPKQCGVAGAAGFKKARNLHTVRIEGPDRRGLGAKLAQALAAKGLNLRGMSAAAIGKKFICHIAADSGTDAAKVMRVAKSL
jgi:hypothetical protein